MLSDIPNALKAHAPFTALGALTGIGILAALVYADVSQSTSRTLFWILHPMHVLLSALITASIYRLYARGGLAATVLVGYLGSIGIATLSDSIIPYLGESLLRLPSKGVHLGFIEKWWLVNPLAFAGIAIAWFHPRTKLPHAAHVLLSTWASLFHMTMALGERAGLLSMSLIAIFLFLAVWVPCCTSDIVFPLLFARREGVLPLGNGASRPLGSYASAREHVP